mgnify:FL=1
MIRPAWRGLLACLVAAAGTGAFAAPAVIGGCPIFPSDNVWNMDISAAPLDANSTAYVNSIGPTTGLHADFGTVYNGAPNGIPYIVVPGTQAAVAVSFSYADESDPGPYPVPLNAPIEGGPASGGDRHVLVVDAGHCILYELYAAVPQANGSWTAGSGAVYNLSSNAPLRPMGWTSADAAGLPVLPGLVRYDEVASGQITHALRFTVSQSQKKHVWPGRHYASSLTGAQYTPMGQRFRLKASYDVSGFPTEIRVILNALKKYGMFMADNGSNWYISGAPDPRWNDGNLSLLRNVPGSAFEAIDESAFMVSANSGQVAAFSTNPPPSNPRGLQLR